MKIAIPTFGSRVSPRFDCAAAFLVVDADGGNVSQRTELAATGWAPHERINRLLELGVDTVICGGIDCWSVESLQSAGVTVYGWVAAELEDALAALLRGDLDTEMVSEGGGQRRCRRFPANDQTAGQGRGRGHGRGCGGGGGRGRQNGGPRRGP